MQSVELLEEILKTGPPWKVMSVVASPEEGRVDIHLGYQGVEKKSFFSFGRKKSGDGVGGKSTCPHCQTSLPASTEHGTVTVRHLSISGYATYLHVPAPGSVNSFKTDCVCMKPWRKAGTYCTEELFDHVVEMLTVFSDSENVRKSLKLTTSEMQQILETSDLPGVDRADQNAVVSQEEVNEGIPGFDHPSWLKLVKGELVVQSKVVAFSMILSRVQAAYLKNPTIDTGVAGVKMLRQFFLRNERLLGREIDLINGSKRQQENAAAKVEGTASTTVPDETSLVWQQFAKGELKISTNQIALQMLLGQIQKSLMKNPSETTVKAGIRNVRSYFVKNERRLVDEIAQLKKRELA